MLVTTSDKSKSIFEKYNESNNWYFQFSYIALVGVNTIGEIYHDVPIIATTENMLEKAKNISLDGVYIIVPFGYMSENDIRNIMHGFQQMGVTMHININALELDIHNKMIENLGFFKWFLIRIACWIPDNWS